MKNIKEGTTAFAIDDLKIMLNKTKVGASFNYPRKYQTRVHAVAVSQGMIVKTKKSASNPLEITVTILLRIT